MSIWEQDVKNLELTESNVSKGRLSRWRLMTAFPSRWTSLMLSNPKISRPPSVNFFSLSFSGTSLNIHNSESGARKASNTYRAGAEKISTCQPLQIMKQIPMYTREVRRPTKKRKLKTCSRKETKILNTIIISSMSRRQPQKSILSGYFGGSKIRGQRPLRTCRKSSNMLQDPSCSEE